eukprot:Opistho-2@18270
MDGYDDGRGDYVDGDGYNEEHQEYYDEDQEPHSQPQPKYRIRGTAPRGEYPGHYVPAYAASPQRGGQTYRQTPSRQHPVHNVTLAGLIKHQTPSTVGTAGTAGHRRRQSLPETPWSKIYNGTLSKSVGVLSGRSTVFDRLSDPNSYTGVYRQRFLTGSGTLNGAASDGIVRDLSQIVRAESRGSTFVRHNGNAWEFTGTSGNVQDTPAQRMCTDSTVYRAPVKHAYIL